MSIASKTLNRNRSREREDQNTPQATTFGEKKNQLNKLINRIYLHL